MTLTRYLAHLPRWGVEVAVALEDGTQSPSRRRRQRLYAVTECADHFCFCGGFRLPGCRSIHALRRPAAEKRQGTKSREVGHRWGSGRYGDYMSAPSSGVDALLLEYGWRIRTLVRS